MVIRISESQFKHLKDTYRLGFDGVNGYAHIDENVEDEVSPSEVDLTSFNLKDSLSGKIWDKEVLDSKVRLRLLDIADDFVDFLHLDWAKPKDILLTGSICNFNWSDKSDIDVHVVYDFGDIDSNTELVSQYVKAKKNEWNENHSNLTIYGFAVELYVENSTDITVSKGIYSLEKNKWLSTPKRNELHLSSQDDIKDISAELMTMIDELAECASQSSDNYELRAINEQIEKLISYITSLRKKALNSGGEMSVGNIAYKALRREGYLDRLYDLANEVYDKLNSI